MVYVLGHPSRSKEPFFQCPLSVTYPLWPLGRAQAVVTSPRGTAMLVKVKSMTRPQCKGVDVPVVPEKLKHLHPMLPSHCLCGRAFAMQGEP